MFVIYRKIDSIPDKDICVSIYPRPPPPTITVSATSVSARMDLPGFFKNRYSFLTKYINFFEF